MASRKKTIRHDDVVKEVFADRGVKNSRKKSSPSFVKLDGLSQSAKDRLMNNRTVKPPKNLNLVEGDPVDTMEIERKSRQLKTFPNEHLLSSKIKEVNGMDFSNHFIEQHYRRRNSESASPEISEDSTISSSTTNDSTRSNSQEEETSVLNISGATGVECINLENDLSAHSSSANYLEDNFQMANVIRMDNVIRNSRYSKNAAIIGLIKNNLISLGDLHLDIENPKSLYAVEDLEDLDYPADDKYPTVIADNGNLKGEQDNNCEKKFDSKPDKFSNFPYLVSHPEDPDFFAHPLQVYGKVDDEDIDFRLPRQGEKTTMTPRQYFIAEGLNDDKFTFQRDTRDVTSKPQPKNNAKNVNLKKIESLARPLRNNNCFKSADSTNSYNLLINDENDGFRLNQNEFPTLNR